VILGGKYMDKVSIHREMAKLINIDIFFRDTRTDGQAILCLHGRWGRGETWIDFIYHYGETVPVRNK
jgi:2-succinyl-6-hydroxy-2,4-cyclohexadiene-1-carboxylate synthase